MGGPLRGSVDRSVETMDQVRRGVQGPGVSVFGSPHLFVHFAFLIGLAKKRRRVFADYGKIMPKWYWKSKKK